MRKRIASARGDLTGDGAAETLIFIRQSKAQDRRIGKTSS